MSEQVLGFAAVAEAAQGAATKALVKEAERLEIQMTAENITFEVEADSDTEAIIEVVIHGHLEGELYVDADGDRAWASLLTWHSGGWSEPGEWVDVPIEGALDVHVEVAAAALAAEVLKGWCRG